MLAPSSRRVQRKPGARPPAGDEPSPFVRPDQLRIARGGDSGQHRHLHAAVHDGCPTRGASDVAGVVRGDRRRTGVRASVGLAGIGVGPDVVDRLAPCGGRGPCRRPCFRGSPWRRLGPRRSAGTGRNASAIQVQRRWLTLRSGCLSHRSSTTPSGGRWRARLRWAPRELGPASRSALCRLQVPREPGHRRGRKTSPDRR